MRNFLRRLAIGSVALLGMLGFGALNSAPAYAATCSTGWVCVWTSANYTGSKLTVRTSSYYNFTYPFDDSITSIMNESGQTMYFYTSYNCVFPGAGMQLLDWHAIPDLNSTFDNKISCFGVS